MEAIGQALDNGIGMILIICVIGITILGVIGIFSIGNNIVTDEAFKVVSDTSKYTCIVSEVDNDLSLDCLRIK